MDNQASRTAGTHHFILTLQMATGGGFYMATFNGDVTPPPGWTRAQIYTELRADCARSNPQLKDANTVFFALERNEL
ncbi:hypothetical protein [Streptomyces sp. NPDC049915]|uniref:hypothetical protein n=1 Tax=Streptomyces sp. NPDC049915 TaxID=3155510 RepID=UPI003433CC84